MLHQTFLFLRQVWQLFDVSQILEFLRYIPETFQILEQIVYANSAEQNQKYVHWTLMPPPSALSKMVPCLLAN